MLPEQLSLGLTAVVVVANVLVTVWLLRLVRGRESSDGRTVDATPRDADRAPTDEDVAPTADANATPDGDVPHDVPAGESADVVQCSTCGVENDPDYRYCRYCVAELSGATTVASATDGPMGRLPK